MTSLHALRCPQFKGARYLTSIAGFVAGLALAAGDVLYLRPGDQETRVLVGVWRRGTPEAAAFEAELRRP
jgi:hypothetical protein